MSTIYNASASDNILHDKIESLRQQNAAQLAELHAISEALGTNEGHSSVDHIVALREQIADSEGLRADMQKQLDTAKSREAELTAHVERLRDALYKCQLFKLNPNNVQAVVNSALSATPAQSLVRYKVRKQT